MKNNFFKIMSLVLSIVLVIGLMTVTGNAEDTNPSQDPSPAIYVYQKNATSVVGIITNQQNWDQSTREVIDMPISSGSGVVYADGGYIVTNYHVINGGDSFQVLMPDGTQVDAELVGTDSSTDIAVLKVDEEAAAQLTPVEYGSTADLMIGSTVVAIGNPGGSMLSNTVTQGIVSGLERTEVKARVTSRTISYIQHDAAINSGNSGGGLFNYRGQLVGINELKYSGSVYSTSTYEGLGFAIPIETIQKIAGDLIEYGEVQRAQLGIMAYDYTYGPDEPSRRYAPAGVYAATVTPGTPAEEAGMKDNDYIYSINGVRVHNMTELTNELDRYNDGDTVTVQVVRYETIQLNTVNNNSYWFMGGSSSYNQYVVSGGYETIDIDVTLKILHHDD